jgi:hypothetical protein
MRQFLLMVIISLLAMGEAGADTIAIIAHPETKGIVVDQDFNFTISPDGQELLFFTQQSQKPYLAVLNLSNGAIRQKELNGNDQFDLKFDLTNDCWSKDSKFCVGPIPGATKNVYATVSPEWVIDLSDPQQLKLTHQSLRTMGYQAAVKYTDFPSPFDCSDCLPQAEPHDKSGARTKYSNGFVDPSVMSPDKRLMYTARPLGISTIIDVKDILSNHENELAHLDAQGGFMGQAVIARLRLSPSGHYLAFLVTYEGGFVSPPNLYIVNVQTHALTEVAQNVYYDVHWSVNPEELYFYKCKIGGGCGGPEDYLYSARVQS